MGKKRKSGGDGAEESVPAKRATAKGGAQPNQRSDQAAAPPRGRVIKAVTTKSSSSSGQGARGKPEDGKAPKAKGASIDDMFGQLKSAKKAAEPAMPPETVLNDNAVRLGSWPRVSRQHLPSYWYFGSIANTAGHPWRRTPPTQWIQVYP